MTVTLDLPDDLHRLAEAYAKRGGVPVEGFLTEAVTMAMAGLQLRPRDDLEFLRERASRADHAAALAALDAVPDVPPDPWDTFEESEIPCDLDRPAP